MREILAAWACCGLVGVGALTVAATREPGIAVEAHIPTPDRLGSADPHLSIEDEFADDASDSDAANPALTSEPPSAYSRQKLAGSGGCWLRSFAQRLL